MTTSELIELYRLNTMRLREEIDAGEKSWGRWRYNPSDPSSIDLGNYDIELASIHTSAELGDWLLRLADKPWITPDDLGQLVVALTDLKRVGYHNLQP